MKNKKGLITAIVILALTAGIATPYILDKTHNLVQAGSQTSQQQAIFDLSAKLEQIKQKLNSGNLNSGKETLIQTISSDADVMRDVDALAIKLDDLREEMHALLADKSQQNNQPETVLSLEQRDALIEERQSNTTNLYVDTLQSEDIDADWSYQAETKTRDALAEASDKLITRQIECRTSMCRLDMAKAEGATNDEALDAFDMNIDWSGEMRMTYDPNTGEGVVFMAREGHRLPQLVN